MIYFYLLNGRENVNEEHTDWGVAGPVVGPFDGVQVIAGDIFHCVIEGEAIVQLPYIDGDIAVNGTFYSDVVFCAKDAAIKVAGGESNILTPEQFLSLAGGMADPWRNMRAVNTTTASN